MILFLFLASGFSALVYQVVWARAAGLAMGNTTAAIGTVVAVPRRTRIARRVGSESAAKVVEREATLYLNKRRAIFFLVINFIVFMYLYFF